MKIVKIIIGLIFAIALLGLVHFIYMDKESIEVNDNLRSELGGTYISTPQGTVHYELVGDRAAETVVLVHGFSVPSHLWEPTVKFLQQQGYQVLRFDLLGRGSSDRPDVEYGLEVFSQQINDVLEALQIQQPINLVGLSMGGPIVARFTHQYPDKVKKLVLQDPLVHQIPNAFISPMDKAIIGEYLARVVLVPSLVTSAQEPENELKVKGWGSSFAAQASYIGFRRAILSSLRYFSSHRTVAEFEMLANVNIPKLLVWGKNDEVVPFSESETLLKLMPDLQFVAVDDAGHIPSVEQPEVFNAALLNFLQE